MAVPSASLSSASVTPAARAALAWAAMQPSQRVVTATASAISSRVLASSAPVPFCAALRLWKPATSLGLARASVPAAPRRFFSCSVQSLSM